MIPVGRKTTPEDDEDEFGDDDTWGFSFLAFFLILSLSLTLRALS